MAILFVVGDSFTQGWWDTAEGGWVSCLARSMGERRSEQPNDELIVYNLGVVGDTSEGLAARFATETAARFRAGQTYWVLIAIGANDATWIPSQGRFKVAPDRFAANLAVVVDHALSFAERCLILNITPVNDGIAAAPPGQDRSRKTAYVQLFNRRIDNVRRDKSIAVIDVFGAFIERNHFGLLSADGFHPNARGHEVIFESVRRDLCEIGGSIDAARAV